MVGDRPAANYFHISKTDYKRVEKLHRLKSSAAHIFWSFPKGIARTICFSNRNFQFFHVNGKCLNLSPSLSYLKSVTSFLLFLLILNSATNPSNVDQTLFKEVWFLFLFVKRSPITWSYSYFSLWQLTDVRKRYGKLVVKRLFKLSWQIKFLLLNLRH